MRKLMSKDDYFEAEGEVISALPNATFKVKLDAPLDKEMICNISGKIRQHFIRILPGDRVKVDIPVADPSRGRITYRVRLDRNKERR